MSDERPAKASSPETLARIKAIAEQIEVLLAPSPEASNALGRHLDGLTLYGRLTELFDSEVQDDSGRDLFMESIGALVLYWMHPRYADQAEENDISSASLAFALGVRYAEAVQQIGKDAGSNEFRSFQDRRVKAATNGKRAAMKERMTKARAAWQKAKTADPTLADNRLDVAAAAATGFTPETIEAYRLAKWSVENYGSKPVKLKNI